MTHVLDPTSPFANRPVEPDTRILFQSEAVLAGLPVLYEAWYWDGVGAESMIFLDKDAVGRDNAALEGLLREANLVREGSDVTFSRANKGFTFVNFNFWTTD